MAQKQLRMELLNQYTSRTVPGFVNVLGTATNTATVSLWSQDNLALYPPTTRQGDYFRGEILFNNNTGALWLTITNVAVLSNYTGADIVTNITGNLLLAKNPEAFTYDADGNLTSDSLWTNVWNGENRRIVIERRSDAPSLSKVKEVWTILADGRWIERIVSTNNGTSYYPSQTNRYVWDNQVLLAVLDHTNGVVMSFLRGLDLSGSIQGAGGVGGVLAVQVGPAGPAGLAGTTHFTCYDGNGNVTALVNAATGEESARYAYGPYAEPLQRTGPMAKLNPIRFSTQYHDDYTEDDKYLFRDLRDGRWPNRDPLGELGFETLRDRSPNPLGDDPNLYAFVGNNPIGNTDFLGLAHNWYNRGRCCNRSKEDQWALVDNGEGCARWRKLAPKKCVGGMWTDEDCEGMTCNGGFYKVAGYDLSAYCIFRCDIWPMGGRRWTPDPGDRGGRATSPTGVGKCADESDYPPGYEYGR